MSSLSWNRIAAAMIVAGLGAATVAFAGVAKVGEYDFAYLGSGDARVRPLQVFDNGRETWFQFKPGAQVPNIFGTKDGKPELLTPTVDGPYVKVGSVHGKFTLAYDKQQANIVYAGQGRAETPQLSLVAENGMSAPYRGQFPADPSVKIKSTLEVTNKVIPEFQANSYATPSKGDRVVWKESESEQTEYPIYFAKGSAQLSVAGKKAISILAESAKSATSITIIGRDDESLKEKLDINRANALKAALVGAGVSPSKIITQTSAKSERKGKLWRSDIRIERVVATPISRPSPVVPTSQAVATKEEVIPRVERGPYAKGNVERLLSAGVINQEQANALLAGPAANEQPVKPSVADVPALGFDFKQSDKRFSATVRRWAAATNYQVVWEAPADCDPPVNGDGLLYASSMKEALKKVVSTAQEKGYDIQATMYSNRVIRFTGASK